MCAHQTATDMPSTALNIAEIADRYTGLLHGIGRQYRLTPEEREDAAQSTWLALCQNADQIRDPQRVPGWLATTMRRFSTAAIRRRHRESPASDWLDTLAMAEVAPELADDLATKHATLRLHQAIANYPSGNDASSSCNWAQPNRDTRRSAAPYQCRSAASDRSAAAPSAGYERSSTTWNNHT
jgi:DNA-directed RNA polymerase specialized sigma24 family protein